MQKLVPDELLQHARPCTAVLRGVWGDATHRTCATTSTTVSEGCVLSVLRTSGARVIKAQLAKCRQRNGNHDSSCEWLRTSLRFGNFGIDLANFRSSAGAMHFLTVPPAGLAHFPTNNVSPINSPGIFDVMIHVDPPPKPSEYFLRSLGF